ncbi:MAG: hypothetical protein COA33_006560 [Fluviicola sp.]|nr:hypothetical protein [Fluviicola sp.]
MKNLLYFLIVFFLFSCASEQKEPTQQDKVTTLEEHQPTLDDSTETAIENNQDSITYISELRLGKEKWNLEEIFVDTLEFVEFNYDYDYYFSLFKNKDGKEITLYFDEIIKDFNQNSNFIVKWHLGQFSEAGTGETIYYNEELLSYTVLNSSFTFEKFIRSFITDYSSGNRGDIQKYMHPSQELFSTFKNGLYCVEAKEGNLPTSELLINDFVTTSEQPKGSCLEGYTGTKNQLYYQFFDERRADLFPAVSDMGNDGIEWTIEIDEAIAYERLAKVLVIVEGEFNRILYFFRVQDNWYFWVEDFCDCSA